MLDLLLSPKFTNPDSNFFEETIREQKYLQNNIEINNSHLINELFNYLRKNFGIYTDKKNCFLKSLDKVKENIVNLKQSMKDSIGLLKEVNQFWNTVDTFEVPFVKEANKLYQIIKDSFLEFQQNLTQKYKYFDSDLFNYFQCLSNKEKSFA